MNRVPVFFIGVLAGLVTSALAQDPDPVPVCPPPPPCPVCPVCQTCPEPKLTPEEQKKVDDALRAIQDAEQKIQMPGPLRPHP